MKVKGKNIYNNEDALEFAKSVRGQYIISQALTIARSILRDYEKEYDIYLDKVNSMKENDIENRHTVTLNKLNALMEPSNRADMDLLLLAFPLYLIHEDVAWKEYPETDEEDDETD